MSRPSAQRSESGSTAIPDQVRTLANYMRAKKKAGEKLVLMLGAGASMSSGIKATPGIMAELVGEFGDAGSADALEDQFDHLWRTSNADKRRLMLEPYLTRLPSPGYGQLADLIRQGYFEKIVTFNFDRLLERALDDIGFRDYNAIIRGETDTGAIARLIASKAPSVKLLKMHGSLHSADYFLFSQEEMLNYPPPIEDLIQELTGNDIIICGYAFADTCVIRAFNPSKNSGSIYYVNPRGADSPHIKGFLRSRASIDKVISGDGGMFDAFFGNLHRALSAEPEPEQRKNRQNLFKFLDHYNETERQWFLGRRQQLRSLLKRYPALPPLLLFGGANVGKTSFVRAGLIPELEARGERSVYVRCQADAPESIRSALAAAFPDLPELRIGSLDWDAALTRIGRESPKRVNVFVDRFERPVRAAASSEDATHKLLAFLGQLSRHAGDKLSFVIVAVDDKIVLKGLLSLSGLGYSFVEIKPLPKARVASLVRHAARRGGVELDKHAVDNLCDRYGRSMEEDGGSRFTLVHIQTICYYLARGYTPWRGYDQVPNPGLLAALESIAETTSLTALLDDLTEDDRAMVRSFLRVICDPTSNTRQIVEFIRTSFPGLRKGDPFPELIP